MRRRASIVLIAALAAGCGAEKQANRTPAPAAKPAGPVLSLTAPPSGSGRFRYDRRRLEAPAGPVTFEIVNRDRWGHNIRIQTGRRCCFDEGAVDLGGTETAQPGQTLRTTVKLEPGRYFFVCSFTSHWGDGMWGRLKVT
jgi:plastocyanin